MRLLTLRTCAVALGVIWTAACTQTGDIGRPCLLVKANPDGGTPVDLLESEIDVRRDVISFGALECDDFICVRSRNTPLTGTPQARAQGTCSTDCVPGSATGCAGLHPDAPVARGRFTCRGLLLDEQSIAAICTASSDLCRRYFGGPDRTPYFCAQGHAGPDGGT